MQNYYHPNTINVQKKSRKPLAMVAITLIAILSLSSFLFLTKSNFAGMSTNAGNVCETIECWDNALESCTPGTIFNVNAENNLGNWKFTITNLESGNCLINHELISHSNLNLVGKEVSCSFSQQGLNYQNQINALLLNIENVNSFSPCSGTYLDYMQENVNTCFNYTFKVNEEYTDNAWNNSIIKIKGVYGNSVHVQVGIIEDSLEINEVKDINGTKLELIKTNLDFYGDKHSATFNINCINGSAQNSFIFINDSSENLNISTNTTNSSVNLSILSGNIIVAGEIDKTITRLTALENIEGTFWVSTTLEDGTGKIILFNRVLVPSVIKNMNYDFAVDYPYENTIKKKTVLVYDVLDPATWKVHLNETFVKEYND